MVSPSFATAFNLLSGKREPVFLPPAESDENVGEHRGWLERERRTGQWRQASAEVAHLPVAKLQAGQAFNAVTRSLRKVSGADFAGIALIDQADPDGFVVESVSGLGLEHIVGTRIPLRQVATAADVVESGRSAVASRPPVDEAYRLFPEWSKAFARLGLAMAAPLRTHEEILGVIFVAWQRGSPHEARAVREVRRLEIFATEAASALRLFQAVQESTRMAVLNERDRIAQDLCTVAIHRLFGIGTLLHGAVGLRDRPEVRRRVEDAIDELDEVNRDVVAAILNLDRTNA
ncbi:GAF domain-containing protein [Actinopolymorpha sp. B11F2]|uniref:GAF domain-containing protein n=1 Tax=Actinopolymorpha sp. B11F2 TaxID=3160862 RepID=UPI0032E3F660